MGVFIQEGYLSYDADGEFAAKFPSEHIAWTGVLAVSRHCLVSPENLVAVRSPFEIQRNHGSTKQEFWSTDPYALCGMRRMTSSVWKEGICGICLSASLMLVVHIVRQMLLCWLHQVAGLCSQECNNLWNENTVLENMTRSAWWMYCAGWSRPTDHVFGMSPLKLIMCLSDILIGDAFLSLGYKMQLWGRFS